MADSDAERGIYRKFEVRRTDGSSAPGNKHERCSYFVLDLDHDPFAAAALRAYAKACRESHPQLAREIEASLNLPGKTALIAVVIRDEARERAGARGRKR